MTKVDYKKDFKDLYLPITTPVIVDVPAMKFISIAGEGNPNGQAFSQVVEALYALSYAVKMSYKSKEVPPGYFEYTVFPLEGVWDLVDKDKPMTDKDNYRYNIMIRQPDFLTRELFERFLATTKEKKPNPFLDRAVFETIEEGLCCQMLHIGCYDDEPESFRQMESYCASHGYTRESHLHREIYLSDPRKTAVDKLRTVLRFPVKQAR
jgi:hypothetical protein